MTDVDEVLHAVKDNADALFTWDYSLARPQLRKLYEKGKTGQWNASTDLPWDTQVDLEAVVSKDQAAIMSGLSPDHYDGTVVEKRLTGGLDSVAEVVDYVETGLGTRL